MDNQDNDDSPAGYKKAGVMTEAQRKMRNGNIEAIKRNWNVEDFMDFFPDSIRPQSFGNSALAALRSISNKSTKSVARTLFLHECQKGDGGYHKAGVSHAQRILKSLIASDDSPKPASVNKPKTKPAQKASKKAHDSDALDSSPHPAAKKFSPDKFPLGRIPKRSSTGHGFTPINKSSHANADDADQFVGLTFDDDDEEDERPILKTGFSNGFHLKHGRGPKPACSGPNLAYQIPYPPGGNIEIPQQAPYESIPKRGRLDLNKGAPATVLKASEKENQIMSGQSKPRDVPAVAEPWGNQFPRRKSETSGKSQPKETLGDANLLQRDEDKTKEAEVDVGEKDHDKAMAEIERKMQQRREMREREAQKLRELAGGSTTTTTPSAPTPFTYTVPVFPDAVARNSKAKSADPAVPTKRPFEEEMGDTIIVDTSSLPPPKRRKAGSAPLEHTEFSSPPPVAPIAPMMGPVQSPLANKRPNSSSTQLEDKVPTTLGWTLGSTTKHETTTTPLEPKVLSPEKNAPIAPIHSPATPIASNPQDVPTPIEPPSVRKEGKVKKTGVNLNTSKSTAGRSIRKALRTINNEVMYIMTLGDIKGADVMEDFAEMLGGFAERFKGRLRGWIGSMG